MPNGKAEGIVFVTTYHGTKMQFVTYRGPLKQKAIGGLPEMSVGVSILRSDSFFTGLLHM